jgi:hypothetical protein
VPRQTRPSRDTARSHTPDAPRAINGAAVSGDDPAVRPGPSTFLNGRRASANSMRLRPWPPRQRTGPVAANAAARDAARLVPGAPGRGPSLAPAVWLLPQHQHRPRPLRPRPHRRPPRSERHTRARPRTANPTQDPCRPKTSSAVSHVAAASRRIPTLSGRHDTPVPSPKVRSSPSWRPISVAYVTLVARCPARLLGAG